MKKNPMVQVKRGVLFTTSLDVAEKFGKRHDTVLRAIKNLDCSSDFRLRSFAESSYLNEQGKAQPMFEISKRGFQFLAMGFRGKKAAEWKERYIDAFERMELALLRQANIGWMEQRELGKVARRTVTDSVRRFIEYAESQGSNNAHYYYVHITKATYKALFIVKDNAGDSFRDLLDTMQLHFLGTAEYVASKALEDGMAAGLQYKKIYQLAKRRVETFAATVPGTKVIETV